MVDDAPKQEACCADTSALERALADAQQKLTQLQEIQRAARVQMILLVCVIIVIMLVFGTKMYTTVRANFDRETMTQQLMDRLPSIVDAASRRLTVALKEAAPVYAELAQERVKTLAPVLRADAEKHLRELPKALQAEIMSQLQATAHRAALTVQKQTQTTFPYLADSRAEQVMEHFVAGLDRESQKVKAKAEGYFQKELVRVHDIFGRFEVPPTTGIEKFELERALVHELLMYVDYEVMAIGTSDELDVTAGMPGK